MAEVTGNEFDNVLVGTGGDDVYEAGAGDDLLFDLGGGDVFDGGPGNDTLILDPEGQLGEHEKLTDAVFDVEVSLQNGRQSDGGVAGDADVLRSIENYTHVGKFNMAVIGDQGANVIQTDEGSDVLRGNGGNDVLSAGAGEDILSGGAGLDTLTGGEGSDRFEFELIIQNSTDTITDFEPGLDVLAFGTVAARGSGEIIAVDGSEGAVIMWSPGGGSGIEIAVLEGVSASEVSSDDFVFDL